MKPYINLSKFKKLMWKFLTIAIAFIFSINILFAQSDTTFGFRSPLDFPLYLSGSYGELRANHFHAGLDLKTMGEIGKPVYSAQKGYVSRIKIQSGGYGRAIYINHPNGFTTVYGHLDRYKPEIQQYVLKNQYDKHSYEVDIYPPKNMFVVERGDLIAYSGNTGASGGPHVHFEIRKNDGEIPLNGLRFGLPIVDDQRPDFKSIYAYSFNTEQSVGNNGEICKEYMAVKKNDSTYMIRNTIEGYCNYLGFASDVYDYMNGSSNPCGIYSLVLKIDGRSVFSFIIDNISFMQTSYADAHMDYELYMNEDKSVHRLFKLPNNNLPIYNTFRSNGIYHFVNDTIHDAEILACDAYGNKSVLKFKFRKGTRTQTESIRPVSDDYIKWDQGKSIQSGNVRIYIPSDALYRDIYFKFSKTGSERDVLNDTFYIHTDTEPLNKNITIQLMIDSVDEAIKDKLLFVRLKRDNKLSPEGGEWFDGRLTTFTKNFGRYVVMADTTPPKITPINFINNKQYVDGQQLTFTVIDAVSGLKTYNAYINDKWILLEYDAKSDMISYTIDKARIEKGKICRLKIFAMDQKNNISVFEGQFYVN
jgi:murein DD-endopeptidase MepM/ murein hydrolase activator NlpD